MATEPTEQMEERLGYSIARLAGLSDLSEPFVRLEIKRGNLKARKIGRRVIILRQDAEVWLGAKKGRPTNRWR